MNRVLKGTGCLHNKVSSAVPVDVATAYWAKKWYLTDPPLKTIDWGYFYYSVYCFPKHSVLVVLGSESDF